MCETSCEDNTKMIVPHDEFDFLQIPVGTSDPI